MRTLRGIIVGFLFVILTATGVQSYWRANATIDEENVINSLGLMVKSGLVWEDTQWKFIFLDTTGDYKPNYVLVMQHWCGEWQLIACQEYNKAVDDYIKEYLENWRYLHSI